MIEKPPRPWQVSRLDVILYVLRYYIAAVVVVDRYPSLPGLGLATRGQIDVAHGTNHCLSFTRITLERERELSAVASLNRCNHVPPYLAVAPTRKKKNLMHVISSLASFSPSSS